MLAHIKSYSIHTVHNRYSFIIMCGLWKFFTPGGGGATMGENHSFWLLKRFLIFQGISGDLDANLLKHISLKIQ